jgi:prepilin-type N-terminal cleavage/methylation domain-containing protein
MMYIRLLGRSRHRQLGFTLIELVMSMAVGGLVMAAATATIQQMLSNNSKNAAHMQAVKQVENALHFLARDLQMAQTVQTSGLGANEVLKVSWVTWASASNQVTYSWNAVDSRLTRTASVDNVTSTVAYSVNPRPVFSPQPWAGGEVTISMTASVRGASESRVVGVVPRPAG